MTDYGGFTYPTLSPYVFYEDLPAALDFLAAAFGFTERMRNVNPDGSLSHCEMTVGDSVLMLGTPPDYENPAHSGHVSVDMPYGVRSYGALDPEGHQWFFAQPRK
jgi:PhnB protein